MNISLLNSLLYLAAILALFEAGLLLLVKASAMTPKRKSPFKREMPTKSLKREDPEPVPASSSSAFIGILDNLDEGRNPSTVPTPSEALKVTVNSVLPINWGSYARALCKRKEGDEDTAISMNSLSIRLAGISGLHYVFPEAEPEIIMRENPDVYNMTIPRIPAGDYDVIMVLRVNRTRKPLPDSVFKNGDDYHKHHRENRKLTVRHSEFVLPMRLRYRDVSLKMSKGSVMAGDGISFQLAQLAPNKHLLFQGSEGGAHLHLVQMPKDGSDHIGPEMSRHIGFFEFATAPTRKRFELTVPDNVSGFHQIIAVQKFVHAKTDPVPPVNPEFIFSHPQRDSDGRFYIVIGRSDPFVVVSKIPDISDSLASVVEIPKTERQPPISFGKFAPTGGILARDESLTPIDLTLRNVKLSENLNKEYPWGQRDQEDELGGPSTSGERDGKGERGFDIAVRGIPLPKSVLSRPITQMANWYLHYPGKPDPLPGLRTKDGERPALSKLADLVVPKYFPGEASPLFAIVRRCPNTVEESTGDSPVDARSQEWTAVPFKKGTFEETDIVVESMIKAPKKGVLTGRDFVPTTYSCLVLPRRREVWTPDKENPILLKVRCDKYYKKITVEIGLHNALVEFSRGKSPFFGNRTNPKCFGGVRVPFYALAESTILFTEPTPAYKDMGLCLNATFDSIEPAAFSGLGVFTVRTTVLVCQYEPQEKDIVKQMYEYSITSSTPLLALSNTPATTARNLVTQHILQDVLPCSRPNHIKGKSQESDEGGLDSVSHRPLHSSEYICLGGDCRPVIKGFKIYMADKPHDMSTIDLPYKG